MVPLFWHHFPGVRNRVKKKEIKKGFFNLEKIDKDGLICMDKIASSEFSKRANKPVHVYPDVTP